MDNNIKDILKLNWKEIEALPKENTILFLTFAPIEEHGHHLPLGVDIVLGERWKNKAIDLVKERNPELTILTMPFIPFAYGTIKGFPGNLHFKQSTIYKVAYELLENISKWGIKNIVIIASHGEPGHLIAIEEACDKINKKYGLCAISPMGAFFSYDELGIDLNFQGNLKDQLQTHPNDFHAGWLETSAMLAIDESVVSQNYVNQPDLNVEEKEMMFPNKVSKKIAGYGHIGFPRLATKELGEMMNQNTSEFVYKASMAFVNRKEWAIYQHHSLYKILFLRTFFVRNVLRILGIILLVIMGIWIIKIHM